MADRVQYDGTGRRKSAIARVFLRPGTGDFKVNGRRFDQYFVTESQRSRARQPLISSESVDTFRVIANAPRGGGAAPADAVTAGSARALLQFNWRVRNNPR